MIDLGKKNVIGVTINAIDYDSTVHQIIKAAKERKSLTVSALAVHGVITGVQDAVHRYRLNQFDILTPDGQPVRWAMNLMYKTRLPDRVYGPNLMLKICEKAAHEGLSIYLYGSSDAVLIALEKNLIGMFPALKIAGKKASEFRQISTAEKIKIAEMIRSSDADILFVGLGCPRQEVWAYEHRAVLSMPLIAVGAAFDFHAGLLDQAPLILQNLGLEWFFRLVKEPKRLWKRYVFLNPIFVWNLFLQMTKLKRFAVDDTVEPTNELRYG